MPSDDRPRLTLGAVALRRWRLSQRLTQFELSARLGLRYDKAARIERGIIRPNLALAVRIEELCGIPVKLWTQNANARQRREFFSAQPRGPLPRAAPDDEGDEGVTAA